MLMVIDFEQQNPTFSPSLMPNWGQVNDYRCHVSLIREDDGTISAIVLNLPGAGSCGDSEEEALKNVREAILGVIESHQTAGEQIPWLGLDEYEIPQGVQDKWIIVNA
jgi:predicted RNase H-like HicB family nuclease